MGSQPRQGLGARWVPASLWLGTEEDPSCSSGNCLWASGVVGKWDVSSLSAPWESRKGSFWKSEWEILLQKTQPKANGTFNLKLKFIVKHPWGLRKLTHLFLFTSLRTGLCQHVDIDSWQLDTTRGSSVIGLLRLTQSVMQEELDVQALPLKELSSSRAAKDLGQAVCPELP